MGRRHEAAWRRRLRFTRAGGALVALTLGVGFAALNTGNNLLFFGWGLMLSCIVVSGILSEATLRAISVEARAPPELRAGVRSALPFAVENKSALPAFAVELQALLAPAAASPAAPPAGAGRALESPRSFLLRVDAGARRDAELPITPARRGALVIDTARAFTSFPFGFFEKEKRAPLSPPMALVVYPRRVDVGRPLAELLTRLGEAPARRPGAGDEIFSLRPYRAGDDPRRIAWRRTAKTGRVVVKETEAARSHDVLLELAFTSDTPLADLDRAADVCASLAEDLLAAGHAVGLRAGAYAIAAATGPKQRGALLGALALVDARDRLAAAPPSRRAVVVAIVARGAAAPRHAHVVVDAASSLPLEPGRAA